MALPLTAKTTNDNHLEIGGVDLVKLAVDYGTPLFVYDEADIRYRCRQYKKFLRSDKFDTELIYAGKAFTSLAICRLIQEEGFSLDVASGGELYVADRAGFPAERIYMHGNNKTPAELAMALRLDVGYIVVDSFDELRLLEALAKKADKRPKILLRITPGIQPSTHKYIQTGQVDSKFGFGLKDGAALTAVEESLHASALDLVGLHLHIGSQIFALHSFSKAIENIIAFAKEVVKKRDFNITQLNLGGGLGIKYGASDEPSSIKQFCQTIVAGVESEINKTGLAPPKILVEPGRSITGSAGITLYTVGTIKKIKGVRTYVSVDGGMSDNLRPMLYGAKYDALLANKINDRPTERVTIAGKHCETGDILIKDVLLPKLEIGDIICTPATGAYGYAMANNYNRQPRPAVIMVSEGGVKQIIRRESYEDLLRLEE